MADLQTNINQARADFNAIREKIIEKGVEIAAGTRTAEYAEKIDAVYDKGKQAEYDAFWDAVQQNGDRTDYARAFLYWGSEYIRPKYKVVPTTLGGGYNTIYRCPNLKKIEAAYFDFSQLPYGTGGSNSHSYGFGLCPQLEEIEDVGLYPSYSYSYAFISCYALRKVACIRVDVNTSLLNIFQSCTNLEEVTFEGEIGQDLKLNVCAKLTKDSITSIINHLSDTASGKTLTLSKVAVDEGFKWSGGYMDENGEWVSFEYSGTDDGSGNEWYPLVATKPNWTITLV